MGYEKLVQSVHNNIIIGVNIYYPNNYSRLHSVMMVVVVVGDDDKRKESV